MGHVGVCCFFFQAEDGIRDAQESRGLGDVYKRQARSSSLMVSELRAPSISRLSTARPVLEANCVAVKLSLIHI